MPAIFYAPLMKNLVVTLVCLLAFPASAQDAVLHAEQAAGAPLDSGPDDVGLLIQAQSPELAISILGESQPVYAENPDGWRDHERRLADILVSGARWQQIADRYTDSGIELNLADYRWTRTLLAQAWLELDRASDAIVVLRELIWSAEAKSETELRQWRRMLIRAWQQHDELDSARVAIQRFQQDYSDTDESWSLERARLALRVMAPEEALALLENITTPEADVLRMIAELWSGSKPPANIVDRAVKIGVDKQLSEEVRRVAWSVVAEAADILNNDEARIAALERGLVLSDRRYDDAILPLNADQLWQAYVEYGRQLGNDMQLIVGEDETWFLAASNVYDQQPIHARALFSVVALEGFRENQSAVAHSQLATLLDQRVPLGGNLMRALYLASSRFPTPQDVPPSVRYLLLNHVLAMPDIPLASELVRGLDLPPPETDPVAWQLRRARVLLLGGKVAEGIAVLDQLLSGAEPLDNDRTLQVVFDVQALDRHEDAVRFFMALLERETEPQKRRELYYWMGDSFSAMDRHADAARAYFKSALLVDPRATDPWAQTSRFRAAEALIAAGMYRDARAQFQTLLNSTRDVSRQAVLRNQLQQLQLLEQKKTGNENVEQE